VGYNGELRKNYYEGCKFSGNGFGKYLKLKNIILIKESLRKHITSLKHHCPNLWKPINYKVQKFERLFENNWKCTSSALASSTLIILFSEMLKFSKIISSKSKNIIKENTKYLEIFHFLK
jgi:hypothetical protein